MSKTQKIVLFAKYTSISIRKSIFIKFGSKTNFLGAKNVIFHKTPKREFSRLGVLWKITFFAPKKWVFDPNFMKIDFLIENDVYFAKSPIFRVFDRNYVIWRPKKFEKMSYFGPKKVSIQLKYHFFYLFFRKTGPECSDFFFFFF